MPKTSQSRVAIVIKSQYGWARQLLPLGDGRRDDVVPQPVPDRMRCDRIGMGYTALHTRHRPLLLLLIINAGPGHFNDLLNLNHLYWQQSRCEFVTFS